MNYIIILIVSAVAQYYLPWWVIAPIAFAIGAWKSETAFGAYAAAAGAIATLWVGYATFLNSANEGIMVQKIGGLFSENIKFFEKSTCCSNIFYDYGYHWLAGGRAIGYGWLSF